MQKNAAVILSAGAGKRMHQSMPKQYLSLCGKPVIAWTIEVFQQSPDIDEIVLVTGPDQVMKCREEIVKRYGLTKVSRIVPGGEERGDSVLCGLHALSDDISCVLIHDGARPLVSQEVIVRAAEAAALYKPIGPRHKCANKPLEPKASSLLRLYFSHMISCRYILTSVAMSLL